MYARLLPVAGERLAPRQVHVQGEEVPLVAEVDVPLHPGHVAPALPGVDVQPIRGDHAWAVRPIRDDLVNQLIRVDHYSPLTNQTIIIRGLPVFHCVDYHVQQGNQRN